MEEIIDAVTFEIENSGYYEKLAGGIVLTGGGALLRHLPQLVKFKTGMDVRIGFPNEHLTGEVSEDVNQPMYSTSIGLVLKGYEYLQSKYGIDNEKDADEPKKRKETSSEPMEGGKLFERWKKTLTEIFAENDAKME